ncbi:MAG: hypothetical protein HY718_01150, partial [Planctomycetes bacterium]|nr:hypothetical protein [Planctomycetota bacterium]
LLARPAERFRPTAVYDRDGDCIEFLAKPDPFLAERVDDLVTVYYSQETGDVIGSLIKGVSTFREDLLGRMPGFKIVIEGGRVRLEHIFLARLWAQPSELSELATLTYKKLIAVAQEANVEADLCLA